MSMYSTRTVLVPIDMKTYLGEWFEYILLEPPYKY